MKHGDFVTGQPPKQSAYTGRRGIFLGTLYYVVVDHACSFEGRDAKPIDIYWVLQPSGAGYLSMAHIRSPQADFELHMAENYQTSDFSCLAHYTAFDLSRTYVKDNWWNLLQNRTGEEWNFLTSR